jgi:hypothetical protein
MLSIGYPISGRKRVDMRLGPKKSAAMPVNMTPELKASFEAAIVKEMELTGTSEMSAMGKVRELIADYVKRIESITQSAEAQYAASVLRKSKGARRGARG